VSTTNRILGDNLSRRAFLSPLALVAGAIGGGFGLRFQGHRHRSHRNHRRADGAVDTGGRSTANEDTHPRGITHV